MSNWFLVLVVILASTIIAFTLAEWLSRRYSAAIRQRMETFAGSPSRDPDDAFDEDERAGG